MQNEDGTHTHTHIHTWAAKASPNAHIGILAQPMNECAFDLLIIS